MTASELISIEHIRQAIILLRGQKVMLDSDLASLYGVPTKALKQAVKRNAGRFPDDFMFVLTPEEFANWRSQFVTSRPDRMGLRHAPMAFRKIPNAVLKQCEWGHDDYSLQVENLPKAPPKAGQQELDL